MSKKAVKSREQNLKNVKGFDQNFFNGECRDQNIFNCTYGTVTLRVLIKIFINMFQKSTSIAVTAGSRITST